MKPLAERLQDVRAYVAEHLRAVPGSSSYVMQLDAITNEIRAIEDRCEYWKQIALELRDGKGR